MHLLWRMLCVLAMASTAHAGSIKGTVTYAGPARAPKATPISKHLHSACGERHEWKTPGTCAETITG